MLRDPRLRPLAFNIGVHLYHLQFVATPGCTADLRPVTYLLLRCPPPPEQMQGYEQLLHLLGLLSVVEC